MSSFQSQTHLGNAKKYSNLPDGIRFTPNNAQVLISTGIASLDTILGGGLAIGTCLLVEEDHGSTYATLMLEYFIAQGLVHGNQVAIASADVPPISLASHAPAPLNAPKSSPLGDNQALNGNPDKLLIAWRYQNKPKIEENLAFCPSTSNKSAIYCHTFDMSKQIKDCSDWESFKDLIHCIDLSDSEGDPLDTLYSRIFNIIKENDILVSSDPKIDPRPALRIAIHAVCSPMWTPSTLEHASSKWMHQIKALLRRSFAVAFITWSYAHSTTHRKSMRALSDYSIGMDCFHTSINLSNEIRMNPKPKMGDFTGFVHLYKVARLNSFIPASVKVYSGALQNQCLAFTVKRKQFLIEPWVLPPMSGQTDSHSTRNSCTSNNLF